MKRLASPCLVLCIVLVFAFQSGWFQRTDSQPHLLTRHKIQTPIKIQANAGISLDDQTLASLAAGLAKLRMQESIETEDLSNWLHCLRLWSPAVNRTQQQHLQAVLNRLFHVDQSAVGTPPSPPIVFPTRTGARYQFAGDNVPQEDGFSEAHVGQTISVLSEIGIPLSQPLSGTSETLTLQAVLDDRLANFNLDEEIDWSAVAFAHFLPPKTTWMNKYNQEFSFDTITERLLERDLGNGSSCGGTHTLYTLVVILRIDQLHSIITDEHAQDIRDYLEKAVKCLIETQGSNGEWDLGWANGGMRPRQLFDNFGSSRTEEISITGHHLEWMALAPNELRVERSRLKQAALYLCRAISLANPTEVIANPCTYSHGLRAVCLLLDRHPENIVFENTERE